MAEKRLWPTLILVLTSFGWLFAQTNKPDQNALIDDALKLSGAENRLAQIPGLVLNRSAGYESQLPPKRFEAFSQIMKETFAVNTLYKPVKANVQKNFDQERIAAVLKGLRTPLVQKMTKLEAEASKPEAVRQISLFGVKTLEKPPTAERKVLIERLAAATGATELAIEIPVAIIYGIAKVTDLMLPPGMRSKKRELDESVNLMRTRHRPEVKNYTQLSLLYTYRSVSDSELKQYVEVLESGSVKWFNTLLNKGLMAAVGTAFEGAAQKIAKTLPAEMGK